MAADYLKMAQRLVARAKRKGARQAEAYVEGGRARSCRVRGGGLEALAQATAKGVGVRVIVRNRLGFAFTSDFDPASLDAFVDRALQLAEAAAPTPLNALPDHRMLAGRVDVPDLFDPEVAALGGEWKIR